MNLLELRTEIRRILAETSVAASYFSDTDINKFINEGIKHMCIEANVYDLTKVTTVLTTIAAYILPLNFLTAKTLLNPYGIPLDPNQPNEIGGRYLITGKPLYYYIRQATLTRYTRQNSTVYLLNDILIPIVVNGYMYEVTTAGTTGGTPPTYPTNPGTSVSDGTTVLTCRELATGTKAMVLVDTPTTAGFGTGTYTLFYSALDEGLYLDTDSPNFPWDKHHYLILYGAHRCALKGKDLPLALAFLTDYSSGLGLKITAPGAETQQPT